MLILEIVRLEESSEGTFGILKINKSIFCATLEPRDEENQVNISSIPAQQYIIKPYNSPTHGPTWRVENVPNRSYILFHAGNVVAHTAGCIILGEATGKLRTERQLVNSGNTFNQFKQLLGDARRHHLTIHEKF